MAKQTKKEIASEITDATKAVNYFACNSQIQKLDRDALVAALVLIKKVKEILNPQK